MESDEDRNKSGATEESDAQNGKKTDMDMKQSANHENEAQDTDEENAEVSDLKASSDEASDNNLEDEEQNGLSEDSGDDLELARLKAENTDYKDRLIRLMADMENLRRRTTREKEEMGKYAISNFAKDVLTMGDNLSRALEAVASDDVDKTPALIALVEGVEMTEREMVNTLERYDIHKINPEGERFDPNLHQAMYEIPDTTVFEGTVIQVVQAGYTIHDRVLRPAMVGVSKGGAKWNPSAAGTESTSETDTSSKTDGSGDKPRFDQDEDGEPDIFK